MQQIPEDLIQSAIRHLEKQGETPTREKALKFLQGAQIVSHILAHNILDKELGTIKFRSVLMGADQISDYELLNLGIEIMPGDDSDVRKLIIPFSSLAEYSQLVARKLSPGFWNDIVGTDEVYFIFKMPDGEVKEFVLSEKNRLEIAKLCSQLNADPIEKTSDLLNYLAENEFYSDYIAQIKYI